MKRYRSMRLRNWFSHWFSRPRVLIDRAITFLSGVLLGTIIYMLATLGARGWVIGSVMLPFVVIAALLYFGALRERGMVQPVEPRPRPRWHPPRSRPSHRPHEHHPPLRLVK